MFLSGDGFNAFLAGRFESTDGCTVAFATAGLTRRWTEARHMEEEKKEHSEKGKERETRVGLGRCDRSADEGSDGVFSFFAGLLSRSRLLFFKKKKKKKKKQDGRV